MENFSSVFISLLISLCGGAILLIIPKTRKHYWWVVIITSIIVIAFLFYRYSPYRLKIVSEKSQLSEVPSVPKTEEPSNPTNIPSTNSQIKPNVKVQEENQAQESDNKVRQQTTSTKSNDELDNEVQHNGYLTIRVLENSQPIPFVNYWVSCAIQKQKTNDSEVLSEEVYIGDFNGIAFINCKINNYRWFLEVGEPMMPNCHLVINGKIIPDKYIIMTNDNKSSNYTIKLKKI